MSRIIAGSLASRRFATPTGTRTRPTTDRVRESIFAYLASALGVADHDPCEQLAGLRFLDLFAGSGGVGLEAYSRGAEVTWVDKATAKVIERNLDTLGASGRVVNMDVTRFLLKESSSFDIIWMDPPYETQNTQISSILRLIDAHGWIKCGGLVLLERSGHGSAVEFSESFSNVGVRRYGDTTIFHAEKGDK